MTNFGLTNPTTTQLSGFESFDKTDVSLKDSKYENALIGMYTIEPSVDTLKGRYMLWLEFELAFNSAGLADKSDTTDGLNPSDDTWCSFKHE